MIFTQEFPDGVGAVSSTLLLRRIRFAPERRPELADESDVPDAQSRYRGG